MSQIMRMEKELGNHSNDIYHIQAIGCVKCTEGKEKVKLFFFKIKERSTISIYIHMIHTRKKKCEYQFDVCQ